MMNDSETNATSWCSDIIKIESPSDVVWVLLDGVLFILIVSGNIVTLYVLRTSLQYNHLVSNRFVLSLAISDTMVGCTLPYHMAFYIAPPLAGCKIICLLRFVLILLACSASIINVMAIAIDRYLAILHPFKYETLMTTKRAHLVLGIGWFNAILVSTVPLYWNSWHPSRPCELGHVLPKYYTIAVMCPAILAIWAVMFTIYWRIWREAVQQAYKLRRSNISQLKRSCLQVVLIIMGCFTVCWMPFLAVMCAQSVWSFTISPVVYRTVMSLAFGSSAVNPLIYAWKNTEFKRMFGHMVRCRTASHSLQNDRSSIIEKQQQQPSTPRDSLLQEAQSNV